jgi:arylsulfatase A-like enzyme
MIPGRAVRGFAIGALVGVTVHFLNLGVTAQVAHDEASQRVSAELARLGHETAIFVAFLALAVLIVAGLFGATVEVLAGWAGWRRAWSWPAIPLGLLLLVLRAFVKQPALLEPSLGGSHSFAAPALALLASAIAPWQIDLSMMGAALAALILGARKRKKWWPLVFLLLLVVPFLPPRGFAPKLLVLAVDSLRPDHLGAAPHLEELEKRGLSFDVALSPMASTTPAWVSLLTGRYPHSTGVRTMFPRREWRVDWLDTLPRRLQLPSSVVADYAGDFFPIFDFGFTKQVVPPPLTLGLVFEREVVTHSALALALLNHRPGQALFPVLRFLPTNADPERLADEVLAQDQPVVFAFFSTTHVPFAAPWPFYRKLASPRYGGPHRYLYDIQKLSDLTGGDVALPARDVEQVRGLYDGAVASVDRAIGRILAHVGPDTTVVVLADHGENLFEPGNTTFHGKWFRGGDEANRVPLIFVGPKVKPGRDKEPVSLVDVMPTILELMGLPHDGLEGISLLENRPHDVFAETAVWLAGPPEPDGVKVPPLPRLLEADPHDRFQLVLKTRFEDLEVEAKHRMLRRGSQKLLYIPTESGVRWQLFDMERDPHQQNPLPATDELERAMKKFLLRDPERELDAREHLVRRSED